MKVLLRKVIRALFLLEAAVLVGLGVLYAPRANAGSETLQWEYPVGTSVTGFKGYCGTATGQYAATPAWTVAASSKTATVTFPAARQYCVVRAYDSAGESGNSNEVTFLERPTNLHLTLLLVWDEGRGAYQIFLTEADAVLAMR